MLKVGEIQVTQDVLNKIGLDESQFGLLKDGEREQVLTDHGFQVRKPAAKPDDDQKTAGLLKDLQEERGERQRLQALNEQTNARVADLEEKLNDTLDKLSALQKNPGQVINVGDDDFVTGKQFKGMVAQETAKLEESLKKLSQQNAAAIAEAQEVRMQLSEIQVADTYSTEKVGPELEYFNVLEKGTKKMLMENPGYKAVIARSKNPALEGYKIGLLHPDFAKIVKKKETDDVVESIKNPKKVPVTGAGRGGKAPGIDAENMSVTDLMKLSDEQLDKLSKGEEE